MKGKQTLYFQTQLNTHPLRPTLDCFCKTQQADTAYGRSNDYHIEKSFNPIRILFQCELL